ncbi:putative C6 finger domain protein [Aspergillus clavatus NRRL 1]|uniref:C6 finger domain protein, putative n=1 Tax=Aspergillus clavatus (strain ATCC 1007 / CBS 513.65 / DSM 816 / NCTC 3887 / NRRL 1 / QM 1276 / 107) TaxID=344612 RepID=A1CIB2_ASPCL|nr:C6 finger domain protein, putative [Aspergillus clavatus NRRL 1]EAW10617.1 C6 finger domain protein, putative [Aspergillus clavatus NRRL 1]
MAETAEPASAPAEPPKQAVESIDQPAAEPAAEPFAEPAPEQAPEPTTESVLEAAPQATFEQTPHAEQTSQAVVEAGVETCNYAPESMISAIDTALPPIDKTMPAEDTTLPPIDTSLPSLDTSLPPIDSSVPSLPPIDTSLPPLDTTLPATEPGFSFSSTKLGNSEPVGPDFTGPITGGSEHSTANQTSLPSTQASSYHQSNGTYTPQPAQQQQEQQQQQQDAHYQHQYQPPQHYAPPQHQQQNQPSQQQYQQPSSDMYQNHQSPPTHMNGPSQQSHIPQAPIGSPMPSNMPPMSSTDQYMAGYSANVAQMGYNTSAQMRYQLPGDPNKMLSGGRHKKEVKRRTKTGCLTCRKRRIKCDEGHPVCRNCVKSKRECLGYDPVFKTPASTPSAIQPAPNPAPSLVVNPQDPTPSYPAAPPGYMPAASQPFAPSLHSESPSTSTEQQYDYGTPSADPSLGGNNSSNMASVQNITEGGLQSSLNASTNTTANPSEPSSFRVKRAQISDLLALRGIPPPPPHPITSLPPNRLEEIKAVFLATYAPAIDRFFETRWFSEKALGHLLANAQLMAEYSALIDAFNDRNLNDPNVVAQLESFEASVVWSTMTLCRHVMNVSNGSLGQDFDLLATASRLDVIEAMITGEHLDRNPLAQFPNREPAASPPTLPDQLMQRSLDFWSSIGHFLTLHDNEAISAKEIDDTLARCRTLLDTYENRDVIYSIAIARHIGQRWADFPHSIPQHVTPNEKDAGAKLYVAQKFLEQEAGGKGTTQVIKRLCGMVVRSWYVSRE